MADRAQLVDPMDVLASGVDSNRNPLLLPQNQVAWAVNTSFRSGFASPRPGWVEVDVNWSTDETQEAFEDGKFQGAGRLDLGTKVYLAAQVSGRLFSFALNDLDADAAELTGTDINNPNRDEAFFCQADRWLIVQDDQARPWIWDGVTLRRSDKTKKEVPVGSAMAYGNGRLWVAQGNRYIGGDLINSDDVLGAATVLRFEENTVIAEGGGFPVPTKVRGFAFLSRQDTVAGVGTLLVFTAQSIFEFDAPIDRETWKNLNYPIQRFALLAFGTESSRSIAGVNGDLFFRASDGIRSFFWARRDFDTWGNTPVSAEMARSVNADSEALLSAVSSVNFDNRLLVTGYPRWTTRGIVHGCVNALDFDRISGISEPKEPPAWEGIWTGLQILQLITARVNGRTRCFAFVLASDGTIRLFEFTKYATQDGVPERPTPIEWSIETRRMFFGNQRLPKSLDVAHFWVSDVRGEVLCRTRFRPDGWHCWQPWHSWRECAGEATCPTPGDPCPTLSFALPQSFADGSIPRPPISYDATACRQFNTGFDFQFRLEFRGWMVVNRFLFTAEGRPPSQYGQIRPACDEGCVPSNWRLT